MTAREILKILHKDGWYEVDQDGSHKQFEASRQTRKNHCSGTRRQRHSAGNP